MSSHFQRSTLSHLLTFAALVSDLAPSPLREGFGFVIQGFCTACFRPKVVAFPHFWLSSRLFNLLDLQVIFLLLLVLFPRRVLLLRLVLPLPRALSPLQVVCQATLALLFLMLDLVNLVKFLSRLLIYLHFVIFTYLGLIIGFAFLWQQFFSVNLSLYQHVFFPWPTVFALFIKLI